jgi:hypothetical protein
VEKSPPKRLNSLQKLRLCPQILLSLCKSNPCFKQCQPRSILKPGEEKSFVFSFKSDKVGIFNEEWEILTEPALQNSLPNLSLCGVGVAEDELSSKREEFWRDFEHHMDVLFNGSEEDQDEFILKNKTPKKEPPNIRDPAVFAPIFEEKNRDLVLYFTRPVMDGFLSLLDDLDYLHQRNTG